MKTLLPRSVPFRSRRSMAATSHRGRMYCFGGVGAMTGTGSILDVSNELWCFVPTDLSWRKVDASGPWPSARRCSGWTAQHDGPLLWGGSGICESRDDTNRYTFLNDVWRFLPDDEKWQLLRKTDDHLETPLEGAEAVPFPPPRYAMVLEAHQESLFLFGGYTEDRLGKRKLNDVWISRNGTWRQISTKPGQGYSEGAEWPGLRYGSMSTSDERHIYVCGGASDQGDHIDLWRFDMQRLEWEPLFPDAREEASPLPRYCAALTIHNDGLFLFGGRMRWKPKVNFNDLWTFSLTSRRWRQIHGNREPHRYDERAEFPGYHAKAAVAKVGPDWYVLGGEGRNGHVSDFWKYSFQENRWQMISPSREDDPHLW